MIWKTTILLSVALCVLGDEHYATSEQYLKIDHKDHHGHYGELTHIGSEKPEHHEEYAWAYPSYEFSYSVHDPHTHDQKGQKEWRDGDKVKGEYWLIQPDGRKRTVTYHADKHSGFNAIVHYSDDHHHIQEHHGYKHVEEGREGSDNDEGEKHEEPKVWEHHYDKKDGDEDRDREESILSEERRKFDARRGYPSSITPYYGHASRINPRFYRYSQGQRSRQ